MALLAAGSGAAAGLTIVFGYERTTLSEFVVASAQDAARRVIAEHESIRLSREEQLAFVQALLNPPEPNARLKRAAKAYRKRLASQRTGA